MYCRRFHDDLASVEDAADFSRLQAAVSGITDPSVWIGLKRGEPDWFWSLSDSAFYGEGEAEYRRWKTGQLDNSGGKENCVAVDDAGEFWDVSCTSQYTFICYDGKDTVFLPHCTLKTIFSPKCKVAERAQRDANEKKKYMQIEKNTCKLRKHQFDNTGAANRLLTTNKETPANTQNTKRLHFT